MGEEKKKHGKIRKFFMFSLIAGLTGEIGRAHV